MNELYILLQVFLATVFAFSGIAKLASRFSFYETLLAIGLKDSYAKLGSRAFPFVEIASAALLLVEPLRLAGEAILLCMLAGFIIISIRAMRAKDKQVDCQCFGDLVEEPLGTATLIRSIVLVACMIPLLLQGEATGLYRMAAMDVIATVFCSFGIVMIYAIAAAFRYRYRIAKGR
ncbi:MauE/DoxX family redox-associated membrane protein [Paenibacillus methanolicus]|uniref:Methylamine utilization protein MauE n=1 Tax=Paenibacillus methanolicus TaxID=582686 RepID=A0A5S5CK78_9BACL|nr:MauE/DoxX family redox-associated membrane protein [Paenibacillus methanolicus]TYP79403.1 methylamine utilization protein MauE [Paenibacillus methanolicus]